MPNPNKTEIVVILDASDSMRTSGMAPEAASGLNDFVAEQAKEPGECVVTIVQFNSTLGYYVVVERVSAADAPKIEVGVNYHPGGMTPLRETVCIGIDKLGKTLADEAEGDRPGKVIFVIITDGHENASAAEYKHPTAVTERVNHQRDVYSWQFVFLGANICAEEEGAKLGVSKGTTADFRDIGTAVKLTSDKIAMYRSSGQAEALNYTAQERAAMKSDNRCPSGRCAKPQVHGCLGGHPIQAAGRLHRGDIRMPEDIVMTPPLDPDEIEITSTADVEKS